jgi:hypothetical protein
VILIPVLAIFAIDPFVTGSVGVSALSGDAGTQLGSVPVASLYKPENGLVLSLGAGGHWNNWISGQFSYVWSRNAVELQGIQGTSSFAWPQRVRQDALVGDVMLYFRPRQSRLRPYLSTGLAAVRFDRSSQGEPMVRGGIALPSAASVNWRPGLRVAVGIDMMISNGWGFRYSFGETLTKNPISRALSPPAPRNLMNFQNQFGLVKYFR